MQRNIKTLKKLPTNIWRKIAISAWNNPNEPVIYSRVLLRPEKALKYIEKINREKNARVTITHYLGKVCGILLYKHPELNSSILFHNAYLRKGTDIFFHVSMLDKHGNENLSGIKIENCALKSMVEIAEEMNRFSADIKKGNDLTFRAIKKVIKLTPRFLSTAAIRVATFIQYRLNLWSPLLGTKRDTFTSMMLTNIGSLGIDEAFVPFSSYTNVSSICALGRFIEAPVIENGHVTVGTIQYGCWTLDHRVVDGSSAAKMQETFRSHFENPELIEKFEQEISSGKSL